MAELNRLLEEEEVDLQVDTHATALLTTDILKLLLPLHSCYFPPAAAPVHAPALIHPAIILLLLLHLPLFCFCSPISCFSFLTSSSYPVSVCLPPPILLLLLP